MVDPSLFTIPYDYFLVRGLRDNGHDVKWYGRPLRSWEKENEYLGQIEEIFYNNIEKSKLYSSSPNRIRLTIKALSHLYSMMIFTTEIKKWKPDVVHFQWFPVSVIDAYFVRRLKRFCPVVATVHDSKPFNSNPSSSIQSIDAFRAARACNHVIVHTDNAIETMVDIGLSRSCLSRIDVGFLSASGRKPHAENRANRKRLRLLQFGTIKEYKGIDDLIKSIALLDPSIRACLEVVVAGKADELGEYLGSLRDSLGLQQVITLDFRYFPNHEMDQLLREADILLFPYRNIEASGVLFSSLQYCKPVIASRLGIFHELLEDRVHGWLVPAGDINELARVIREAVLNQNLLAVMQANISKLTKTIPSWREIGEKTIEVYRKARSNWIIQRC